MKISGELIKINGNPGVMPEKSKKIDILNMGVKLFFGKILQDICFSSHVVLYV